MGTHLRALSESYLMSTNMTWLSIYLHLCALDKSSLSIGRVNLSIELSNDIQTISTTGINPFIQPTDPTL